MDSSPLLIWLKFLSFKSSAFFISILCVNQVSRYFFEQRLSVHNGDNENRHLTAVLCCHSGSNREPFVREDGSNTLWLQSKGNQCFIYFFAKLTSYWQSLTTLHLKLSSYLEFPSTRDVSKKHLKLAFEKQPQQCIFQTLEWVSWWSHQRT